MTRRAHGYSESTQAGYGSRQSPAKLISHQRYEDRQAGKVPPLEYLPVREAVRGLP